VADVRDEMKHSRGKEEIKVDDAKYVLKLNIKIFKDEAKL